MLLAASRPHIRVNVRDEADRLVKTFHYSGRVPANVQFVMSWHEDGGLFGDTGSAIAAVFYSLPPTRWAEPVWELSRLVRRDDASVTLTGLISESVRWIKRRGTQDLLVSFADTSQGHHGGIYQASSWNYHGLRESRMDGLLVNGKFVPGRSCNSVWGTRSPQKLAALNKPDIVSIEAHYDTGKHLYWKALNGRGEAKAKRLGLKRLPYPKPDRS